MYFIYRWNIYLCHLLAWIRCHRPSRIRLGVLIMQGPVPRSYRNSTWPSTMAKLRKSWPEKFKSKLQLFSGNNAKIIRLFFYHQVNIYNIFTETIYFFQILSNKKFTNMIVSMTEFKNLKNFHLRSWMLLNLFKLTSNHILYK